MWFLENGSLIGKCAHLASGAAPASALSFDLAKNDFNNSADRKARGLGLVTSSSFTHSAQCAAAARKAVGMLQLIRRASVEITPAIFTIIYASLVRNRVEYAVQA